ncbi:MAG: hypothetical protein HY287_11380 [Planctomycetes bacterium]|nr:hypothetical protein [Planctomycetota bacterium]MBI3834921.1 hypothetical protein [Planctomycetota bacterium]
MNVAAIRPISCGIAAIVAVSVAGCQQPHGGQQLPPGPPLPVDQAIAIVNENAAKIHGTLRAVGNVDGHFRNQHGSRIGYHVDGTLFYLPPQCLRFDLKKLGNRQFLFGSNNESYWVYSNAEDDYYCRNHGTDESLPSGEAIQAAQVIEALGLTPIPVAAVSESGKEAPSQASKKDQRITLDMQVLRDSGSSRFGVHEYWLDRRPPRLIRRIEIHDNAGRVIMQSTLGDYRPAYIDGPLVPFLIEVRWPADAADLRFQIGKWSTVNEVTNSSPQFATPKECRDNYR